MAYDLPFPINTSGAYRQEPFGHSGRSQLRGFLRATSRSRIEERPIFSKISTLLQLRNRPNAAGAYQGLPAPTGANIGQSIRNSPAFVKEIRPAIGKSFDFQSSTRAPQDDERDKVSSLRAEEEVSGRREPRPTGSMPADPRPTALAWAPWHTGNGRNTVVPERTVAETHCNCPSTCYNTIQAQGRGSSRYLDALILFFGLAGKE